MRGILHPYLSALIGLFSCLTIWAQNPNDCVNAVLICGTTAIGIEPDGAGADEFASPNNFAPPCYTFNNNTVWFQVEIEAAGTFGFDIVPDNGTDDYDFAVYGPVTDCSNLGASIRCSSTNPQQAGVSADTGLNGTETDTQEGPGPDGNGYLQWLTVNAGERYYILVDRAIGSAGFNFNTTGSAQLPLAPEANPVTDLESCDQSNAGLEQAEFDLSPQIPLIQNGQPNTAVTFHASLNDANIGINTLPLNYTNTANPQTIYARIQNSTNSCSAITDFELQVTSEPNFSTPDDLYFCDLGAPTLVTLSIFDDQISSDNPSLDISYYSSLTDAENDLNAITEIIIASGTVTVYFRVTENFPNGASCVGLGQFLIGAESSPLANALPPFEQCRNPDGPTNFDLAGQIDAINAGNPPDSYQTFFYFSTTDRANDDNRLPLNYVPQSDGEFIYIRVIDPVSGCFTDTQLELITHPNPQPSLYPNDLYCLNSPDALILETEPGFAYYRWSTGEEGPDLNQISVREGGTYTVEVSNEFGCTTSVNTEVQVSNSATIQDITTTRFEYPNNQVEVVATGEGDYEYSLDEGPFQESAVFNPVPYGFHTAFVRDRNGCGIVSERFLVLDYPRFFTPNADGFNDLWYIEGLETIPQARSLRIYNRYGKLLRQLDLRNPSWDGTLNGSRLPADDYWFELILEEGFTVRAHFSLKT
ncbi:T9SS type B sorting domain-containing protein [Croceiramulus getboli]|nr:T9SS type B sorting domain-containing protein [Flavobacteriaceae bacterium YJPT1-3]